MRTKLATLAIVIAACAAVTANYHVYIFRESGGVGGGPWFEYMNTATSSMGGNIALNGTGTAILLDNRNYLSSLPTTIYYNPPPTGRCDPWPCPSEN